MFEEQFIIIRKTEDNLFLSKERRKLIIVNVDDISLLDELKHVIMMLRGVVKL